VAYDVSDPKRLRAIFRKLHGFGNALQYSVFQCDLDRIGRVAMLREVLKIIDTVEDRVMIANLGPVNGQGEKAIQFIGRTGQVNEDDRPLII
jgi:CRISPR-associated protein Cas2